MEMKHVPAHVEGTAEVPLSNVVKPQMVRCSVNVFEMLV